MTLAQHKEQEATAAPANNVTRLPLYRREAQEANKSQAFSSTISLRSGFEKAALGCAALCLALVLYALFFVSYTQKTMLKGSLLPEAGLVNIFAPTKGAVSSIAVQTGFPVHEGAELVTIDKSGLESRHIHYAALKAEIFKRKGFIEQAMKNAAVVKDLETTQSQQTIHNLSLKIETYKQERFLLQQRLSIAQKELENYKKLRDSGVVSSDKFGIKQDKVFELESRIIGSNRLITEVLNTVNIEKSKMEMAHIAYETKISELSEKASRLTQERVSLKEDDHSVIAATQAGKIAEIYVKQGELVDTSSPLISIIPHDSELEAVFMISSKEAVHLEKGQMIQLRFEAYPYQEFGQYEGMIKDIGTVAVPENKSFTETMASQQSKFLLKVRFPNILETTNGLKLQLVPNMTVEGLAEVETRKVINWIFNF